MKKFYMTMAAMLFSFAAMAQYSNELYVPETEFGPEAKGTTQQIQICLKNADPVVMIGFKMKNANGFKFTTKAADFGVIVDRLDLETAKIASKAYEKKELDKQLAEGEIDEDEYNDALEEKYEEIDGYDYADVFKVDKQGVFMFGPAATATSYYENGELKQTTFKGNDGALLTCPITIPADAEDGEYEFTITDIVLASTGATAQNLSLDHQTSTFRVVLGATGIHSINAADSKAPVYNLAGQRVSKTQKGVFIQSGKKVAVK